ncbi:MAG: thioredoxin domain-containing protein [Bacillota bacterium]
MRKNNMANQLINEKSPYLLQHAYNPVNWYPWGQEAFEKAKKEDKPIFLSIGYSTCHWCHVMEKESFEDQGVAEILNQYFVAIKVDREERPDVDAVYMSVCQSLAGQGGWPLTIVMTPDQKPFFAATYIPKTSRYGNAGMMDLLPHIWNMWQTQRKELLQVGNEISSFLSSQVERTNEIYEPSRELIGQAVKLYRQTFDKKNGGFGFAPKFPTPHNLIFLLKYFIYEQDKEALAMAEKTLEQMYRGGIFDHIGGGFSRYSTDNKWLVPHFEKMLYDNALLSYAYLEAYRCTKKDIYRMIAERTMSYVLCELTDEKGGFYCGQDADSEGVEGKYYVFTPQEVETVLGKEQADLFNSWFDITENGNFEGKNIPNLLNNENFNQPNKQIEMLCNDIYIYRLRRTKLPKDDKVLTAWNALMIAAFAHAYAVLGDKRFLLAAQKAQEFIASSLTDEQGRLLVRWRDGEAIGSGNIDDYAFYAWALLELYRADFQVGYLRQAIAIAELMIKHFFDEENGGFYLYAQDSEQLIIRPKEIYDGALPSGNSVAVLVLHQLAKLTGETKWQELSQKQLQFVAANVRKYPVGYSFCLLAMMDAIYPSKELICVTAANEAPDTLRPWLNERSNMTVLLKTAKNDQELKKLAPFSAGYQLPEKGQLYHLCQNATCSLPVSELEKLPI